MPSPYHLTQHVKLLPPLQDLLDVLNNDPLDLMQLTLDTAENE